MTNQEKRPEQAKPSEPENIRILRLDPKHPVRGLAEWIDRIAKCATGYVLRRGQILFELRHRRRQYDDETTEYEDTRERYLDLISQAEHAHDEQHKARIQHLLEELREQRRKRGSFEDTISGAVADKLISSLESFAACVVDGVEKARPFVDGIHKHLAALPTSPTAWEMELATLLDDLRGQIGGDYKVLRIIESSRDFGNVDRFSQQQDNLKKNVNELTKPLWDRVRDLRTVALPSDKPRAGHMAAGSARTIAESTFHSVVMLQMVDAKDQPVSLGSGFFVRLDVVATNLHVVLGAVRGSARIVGQEREYDVLGHVGVDRQHDLILLKLRAVEAQALTLGDSSKVAAGDKVYVVGNPEGLEGTFSDGIVSAIRPIRDCTRIQITAPISRGSSGGPVLNTSGEVIGVACATCEGGQNLNFAIPSSYLAALLMQKGSVSSLAQLKMGPD